MSIGMSWFLVSQLLVSGWLLGLWPLLFGKSDVEGLVPVLMIAGFNVVLISFLLTYEHVGGPQPAWSTILVVVLVIAMCSTAVLVCGLPAFLRPYEAYVFIALGCVAGAVGVTTFIYVLLPLNERVSGLAFTIMIVAQVMVPVVHYIGHNFRDVSAQNILINSAGAIAIMFGIVAVMYRAPPPLP